MSNNNCFHYGLHRESATRHTMYTGDGAGRDTYITVPNGGNLRYDTFKNEAPHTGKHIS
jgi:hypothetical protein